MSHNSMGVGVDIGLVGVGQGQWAEGGPVLAEKKLTDGTDEHEE